MVMITKESIAVCCFYISCAFDLYAIPEKKTDL
jgi:hypothetical protein